MNRDTRMMTIIGKAVYRPACETEIKISTLLKPNNDPLELN